jgi:hypothetical protein
MTRTTPSYPRANTQGNPLLLEITNLRAQLLRAEHYLYTRAPDAWREYQQASRSMSTTGGAA